MAIIQGESMKQIGRGMFSTAYLSQSNEVFIKSVDPIKEVMALGWFPESRLFPRVELIESGLYKMQYYPRVKSLKQNLERDEYQLYLELLGIFQESQSTCPRNIYDNYSYWYKTFESMELSHPDAEEIREALLDALGACANIDSTMYFEISPRNLAVQDGKLILLDCFFCMSKSRELQKQRREQMQARRARHAA